MARSRTMEALVLNRSIRVRFVFSFIDTVELTITGHAGLARYTSRDKDDFSASQAVFEALWCWVVTFNNAVGVDVSDISSDACSTLCQIVVSS